MQFLRSFLKLSEDGIKQHLHSTDCIIHMFTWVCSMQQEDIRITTINFKAPTTIINKEWINKRHVNVAAIVMTTWKHVHISKRETTSILTWSRRGMTLDFQENQNKWNLWSVASWCSHPHSDSVYRSLPWDGIIERKSSLVPTPILLTLIHATQLGMFVTFLGPISKYFLR